MKVLYDHQAFTMQAYGGISRYMFELLRRFPQGQASVALRYSNNAYLQHDGTRSIPAFLPRFNFSKKQDLLHLFNQRHSAKTIAAGQFDILHPTYYDPYFLPHLHGKPFTATFHDMIHERLADRYPYLQGYQKLMQDKKTLLSHAQKVIAVSASTKRDLVEVLGAAPDKIEVIHLASSIDASMENAPRIVAHPYILFVGNRWQYKNFEFLLEALSPLFHEAGNADLKLVCAGGGVFSKHDLMLTRRSDMQDFVMYESIDDTRLVNLYKHAELFIFPSEYEGFGIPALEAMACGAPALLSNVTSLPEVGGDAAVYFTPTDAADIHNAVAGVLHNSTLQADLRAKGYARATQFSWDKTFEKTVNLYRSLL